jgi:hypothetical protein
LIININAIASVQMVEQDQRSIAKGRLCRILIDIVNITPAQAKRDIDEGLAGARGKRRGWRSSDHGHVDDA